MRTVLAGLAMVVALTGAAQAEQRMFVIANDADGYGIDRCLATSDKCGAPAANAYCKQHQFAQAAAYHKIDPGEITGAIPAGLGGPGNGNVNGGTGDIIATGGGGINGNNGNNSNSTFVAIVCTR